MAISQWTRYLTVVSVSLALLDCSSGQFNDSPLCCLAQDDSPCATLSMEECSYHKYARCYIVNDTWGVPRCVDTCGGQHCDPCCATHTCRDYDWSCQFCPCSSHDAPFGVCCSEGLHCTFANSIPIPTTNGTFKANGTCCPPTKRGVGCQECAHGLWGTNCENSCPSANGRVCNGFGTCNDGASGDGSCTCETGHLAPSCTAVDPTLYNCSTVGGEVCAGHGSCTSMLPPKVCSNIRRLHFFIRPYLTRLKSFSILNT